MKAKTKTTKTTEQKAMDEFTASALKLATIAQPVLIAQAEGRKPATDDVTAAAEAQRAHGLAAFKYVGASLLQAAAMRKATK